MRCIPSRGEAAHTETEDAHTVTRFKIRRALVVSGGIGLATTLLLSTISTAMGQQQAVETTVDVMLVAASITFAAGGLHGPPDECFKGHRGAGYHRGWWRCPTCDRLKAARRAAKSQ